MDNFESGTNSDVYKHRHLVIFILLVGILVGLYFWQGGLILKRLKKPVENFEKREMSDKSIPKEFSGDIPLISNSKVVETYKYFDTKIQKDTDGVVVLTTSKSPDKVRKYYQDKLKPPEYVFVEGSDQNDTELTKILVYSTTKGFVVIKIEKTETGSNITLRDSNLLLRTQNLK